MSLQGSDVLTVFDDNYLTVGHCKKDCKQQNVISMSVSYLLAN